MTKQGIRKTAQMPGVTAKGAALLVALIVAASALVGAAPKPTAVPTNSCTTCKERKPTLDPGQFKKGYEAEVAEGYAIAKKYPATLDKIHCFCECAESPMFHHKTLLTCYTDMHAAGCGICLSEARLAAQLKDKGVPDDEIKVTIESVHRTDGHPPTH